VKGGAPAEAAGPVAAPAGAAPWVAPSAVDAGVAAGETQLRVPRARPVQTPSAGPSAEPAASTSHRRRWAVVGGCVVAAAALVGVVVLVPGSADDDPAADPGTAGTGAAQVTALAPTERLPSGLTTVREAAYDPAAGTVTTTVTWSADEALAGPLFEAVPAAAQGRPCPDVVWSVAAVRDVTPGVPGTACGWQVPADVPAGSEVSASYTVPFTPDGDPAQALRQRLVEVGTATGAALDGLVATPVYPAQRLDGLEVQIGGTVRVGAPVDLVVLPVWRGTDAPDNVSVLFSSRNPQPNLLLQRLGGDLEVRTDDCSGALAFTDRVPYANTVGSGCTVAVRLGEVEADSRTFDVLQNSVG
jgi:serine/threonine-protein kinase